LTGDRTTLLLLSPVTFYLSRLFMLVSFSAEGTRSAGFVTDVTMIEPTPINRETDAAIKPVHSFIVKDC